VSPEAAQRTLSALLLGLAVGKLGSGPLADLRGRRPVLLCGLVLFTISSALAASTTWFELLLFSRFVQGVGVAVAAVCARALVRDRVDGDEAARILSIGFSWLGLLALLGPTVAALVADWLGFHAALWCIALFGLGTTCFALVYVRETRPAAQVQVSRVLTRLLHSRSFLAFTSLITLSHVGHFMFLSASSFVLIEQFGLSRFTYSAVLAMSALQYIGGTILCRRWLRHGGIERTVLRASWIYVVLAVVLLVAAARGVDSIWMLVLPAWIYVAVNAIQQACGQAAIMRPFPDSAATASAAGGFVLTMSAAAIGALLGGILAASATNLAIAMAVAALAAAALGLFAVPRTQPATAVAGAANAARACIAISNECSRAA
jgi:DHA1 family bicyclomycin/chloramphenicol resistance-like MFS transporter